MYSFPAHLPGGDLVKDFLLTDYSPPTYLEEIPDHTFNGFNLLAGSADELWYSSNRGENIHQLTPGIYGLSNHLLDTPWPKVQKGKEKLHKLIQSPDFSPEAALAFLQDPTLAPDEALPKTGVPLEWERTLSAMFIKSPSYGTRASTVLLIDKEDQVHFYEKAFVPTGENQFSFQIDS